MNELDTWLEKVSMWYQEGVKPINEAQALLLSVPADVWGPIITDSQSKAIACWLDMSTRIFQHYRHTDTTIAYQTLLQTDSQLQAIVSEPASELELKAWCMKRMQSLTVLALEFCSQQDDKQWQKESTQLVESHIKFMNFHNWNEAGVHHTSPSILH